jgi:hypothetical protein
VYIMARVLGCRVVTVALSIQFLLRIWTVLAGTNVSTLFESGAGFIISTAFGALLVSTLSIMLFCRTRQQTIDAIPGITIFITIILLIYTCGMLLSFLYATTYENVRDAIHTGITCGFCMFAFPALVKMWLQPPLLHIVLFLFTATVVSLGAAATHYGISERSILWQAMMAMFVSTALCVMERAARKNFLDQIHNIKLQREKAVLETARRGEVGGECTPITS